MLIFFVLATACRRAHVEDFPLIDILEPAPGVQIQNDTLYYSLNVTPSSYGMLKISLVNADGVSLVSPQVFQLADSALVQGYFLLEGLDYAGSATFVVLWDRSGRQVKKSVRILLTAKPAPAEAFLLFNSGTAGMRMMHLLADGRVIAESEFAALACRQASWSESAQTAAILQPDGRKLLAIKWPFSEISYTLQASQLPHEIAFTVADGARFWIAEKSGQIKAVRASDGHMLISITGNPDSLPYALANNNQFTAVAFRSGGNKHTVRVFYRQTGALHSIWPMGGKMVDFRWKGNDKLLAAIRKPEAIEVYELSADPPSMRLLRNVPSVTSDTLIFWYDGYFLKRSGFSLLKYSPGGTVEWSINMPGFPDVVAVLPDAVWVRVQSNLIRISRSGQWSAVLVLPENAFTGLFYSTIYAPVRI